MRTKILIGLAVAAALTGGVANASITNPGSNTGEVIEIVLDNTNGHVYARGTQISFSSVLPAVQSSTTYNPTGAPYSTGLTFAPIAADSTLKTFLGQDGGGDSFSFALIGGGQNLGGGSPALGPNKPGGNIMEFTSPFTLAAGNLAPMIGTAIGSAIAALKTDVTTMNGIIGGTAGDGTSADVSTQFNASSTLFALYGNNVTTAAALNTNMNLYAMTGNGTSAGAGQVYTGGLVTMLSNGTLEQAGGAPVPLPAALWLFGSGLLGLAGIGRRRISA